MVIALFGCFGFISRRNKELPQGSVATSFSYLYFFTSVCFLTRYIILLFKMLGSIYLAARISVVCHIRRLTKPSW